MREAGPGGAVAESLIIGRRSTRKHALSLGEQAPFSARAEGSSIVDEEES